MIEIHTNKEGVVVTGKRFCGYNPHYIAWKWTFAAWLTNFLMTILADWPTDFMSAVFIFTLWMNFFRAKNWEEEEHAEAT